MICIACLNYTPEKEAFGKQDYLFDNRMGMLYTHEKNHITWAKHLLLLIGTPCVMIYRIASEIFQGFNAMFTKKWDEDNIKCFTFHFLSAITAPVFCVLMVAVNVLGLIAPKAGKFLYGDLERIQNLHDYHLSDDKSLGRRVHEKFYLAECFQPIVKKESKDKSRQIDRFFVKHLAHLQKAKKTESEEEKSPVYTSLAYC